MLKKKEVRGHRMIMDKPNKVMKLANMPMPGIIAAMVPKKSMVRIAKIKARIALSKMSLM